MWKTRRLTAPPSRLACLLVAAISLGVVWTTRSEQGRGPGDRPAYLNLDLSFDVRAADLVSRMTTQEKISQLVNAPACRGFTSHLHDLDQPAERLAAPPRVLVPGRKTKGRPSQGSGRP